MSETTTLTQADMRPGERLLHGERYVFNDDLLKRHLAGEAVAAAPASLARLGDTELRSLKYAALAISATEGMTRGPGRALLSRIDAEYARRGLDTGGARVLASKREAA